ncbi:MAG: hypothetical protein ACD_74C00155G0017 [uncultured bacterium]|nr:MAG: hypothetical protein ACD_74C00155G0017 [uncultured bacterium]
MCGCAEFVIRITAHRKNNRGGISCSIQHVQDLNNHAALFLGILEIRFLVDIHIEELPYSIMREGMHNGIVILRDILWVNLPPSVIQVFQVDLFFFLLFGIDPIF